MNSKLLPLPPLTLLLQVGKDGEKGEPKQPPPAGGDDAGDTKATQTEEEAVVTRRNPRRVKRLVFCYGQKELPPPLLPHAPEEERSNLQPGALLRSLPGKAGEGQVLTQKRSGGADLQFPAVVKERALNRIAAWNGDLRAC